MKRVVAFAHAKVFPTEDIVICAYDVLLGSSTTKVAVVVVPDQKRRNFSAGR